MKYEVNHEVYQRPDGSVYVDQIIHQTDGEKFYIVGKRRIEAGTNLSDEEIDEFLKLLTCEVVRADDDAVRVS